MPTLSLAWFGSSKAHIGDEPVHARTRKAEALLIYLTTEAALHPGATVRRETLLGLLWPDYPDESARQNLRTNLSYLRSAVAGMDDDEKLPFLRSDSQSVQVRLNSAVAVDVAQFTSLLADVDGHSHAELSVCTRCMSLLEQAAALYTGDFLSDFSLADSAEFEAWASARREAFRRQALEALETLAEVYMGRADMDAAEIYARRQLDLDPMRESAHRQLMIVLARSGQRTAAVAHYERLLELLRDELGIAPSSETSELHDAIVAGELGPRQPQPLAPLASPIRSDSGGRQPVPNNLTPQPTLVVGRESAQKQLIEYLCDPDVRLITITGLGGVGKTRLALSAAEEMVAISTERDWFANGVFFVSLDPLDKPGHIPHAIAEAYGVRLESADRTRQLQRLLRGKQLLLVIDSFEHLLEGATQLSDILNVAPDSKILVTSRERLQLQEEQVFPIGGLEFPLSDSSRNPADFPAIELFLQAGGRVRPGYAPGEDELEMVAEICRRLDGIPLAIELAAAWVATIPLAQIAAELKANLDLLETEMRNVPARHRSMRAIFDATWNRLRDQERKVLGQLFPFRGGFRLHAAKAVSGTTLPVLAHLVDKSLLQFRPSEQRYSMHALLRQFTADKVDALGATDAARDAHSDYYLDFVIQRDASMAGPDQMNALREIGREFENVRAAWLWAARQRNSESIAAAIDPLLQNYSDRARRWDDGGDLWNGAVEHLAPRPGEDASPVYFRLIARHPMPREGQIPLLESAMDFARRQNDMEEVAHCQCVLGWVHVMAGDAVTGVSLLEEGTTSLRKFQDKRGFTYLRNLGIAYQRNGQVAKAQQVFFELLAIHRGSGNLASTGNALSELVSLLRQDGKFRKSAEFTAELVAVYEELELSYGIAIGKFHAALSAFLRGNFEEVENLIRQAVEMLTEASFYHGEFELGLLANLQGQHDQAWLILKRYRGLSRTARSEFYLEWGLSVTAACQERYELAAEHLLTTSRLALEFRGGGFLGLTFPVAALVLAKLGRFKRAAELLALGREHLPGATGWLDKWELFAELPAALVDALGQDAYAAASARGRGLDLWQTAEELLSELSLDRPQPSWPNPEP